MSGPADTGDPYRPWWHHNIVIHDVETTGLEADQDRVVEVGFARFEQGELVDAWGSLVFPEREIPQEATNIHGISTADVSTAPMFIGTLPDALRISRGAWPAAYNASFDKQFWTREVGRLALAPMRTPIFSDRFLWLDPLVWVRHIDGIWGKNKLTVACERYGITLEDAHRAQDDATAAGLLLFRGIRDLMPRVTMSELLRQQQILAEEQERERRAWFRKKGYRYR